MNDHLQVILNLVKDEAVVLTPELKQQITQAVKNADKQLSVAEFKLGRIEKEKKAVSNLLEETIDDLQQKSLTVKDANNALLKSLSDLQATQAQLIQSEKMASLGELTAGIAHEIQNPLNFVNNFSEINIELIDELQSELQSGNTAEAIAIANDIRGNAEKVNHHGKRADAIVKGMLQHSRKNTGKREPYDINMLCDEYVSLSYYGLRAKDKNFNVAFETAFDETIDNISIVPQEIGRVLLNLFNNAFYAVNEKKKTADTTYKPVVVVKTSKENNIIKISVKDNGNGIPAKVADKIFQPFFTTKPTGEGTGLGLSLSYDIVTKGHGGTLSVHSQEGEYAEFVIGLPAG